MKIEAEILRGTSAAVLFIAYFALWKFRRKALMENEGFDPEVLEKDERPSQRLFASVSNVMTVVLVGLLVFHSLGIKNIPGFYYFYELRDIITVIIGLFMGCFGLSICLLAQKTMGVAWRVGIDKEAETNLVDNGIFSYCRNPTYSGLFLVCISTLFIFPTMLFLIWAVSFLLLIEFQVRLEEEYLFEKHGEAYCNYYKKVKRYIPWVF
ncbi:MAG: isoprenylcysteine carboxylmethyltransferase family protein [Deltaproteobacteria bacterium]|nr:isoprenylcysteine carboxylmethyltransferase family protein [Deltaproteobacteria bacterium]